MRDPNGPDGYAQSFGPCELPTHSQLVTALNQALNTMRVGPEGTRVTLVVRPSGSSSFRFGEPLILDRMCFGNEWVSPTSNTTAVAQRLLHAAKLGQAGK